MTPPVISEILCPINLTTSPVAVGAVSVISPAEPTLDVSIYKGAPTVTEPACACSFVIIIPSSNTASDPAALTVSNAMPNSGVEDAVALASANSQVPFDLR